MSAATAWLTGRRPVPPLGLRPWLLPGGDAGTVLEVLTAAGCSEMLRASVRPGPIRESALHLLAADALITYACEAALETDDPARALSATLRAVASPVADGA